MKKWIFCLLICNLPFVLLAQNDTSNGIHWVDGLTWDQVKQKAKQENRYIFLDCYATWCGPCKKMDKDVYPTKEIGDLVNERFIAVKVQMDKTDNDNGQTREWYKSAQNLKEQFEIDGYPSFLFLTSDGKLIHKGIGLHNITSFTELIKKALTDPESRYLSSIQEFKNGQLSFELMPDLARQAWIKKDKRTSVDIARKFKEKYVDSLPDDQAFSKFNLTLLAEFSNELLSSKDRYFKFFYNHSKSPDSIINKIFSDWGVERSRSIVRAVIEREEIRNKIYKNGKPIIEPMPNWKELRNSVNRNYGKMYYDILFPETEIVFYDQAKDWKKYLIYVNKKIKKYPPQKNGHMFGGQYGDEWMINQYAWELFLYCDIKRDLKKALFWADMAINLEERPGVKANYMDTKSNLLYKMGKKKEAIELEERALILGKDYKPSFQSIQKVLTKMKAGKPTWPNNL